MAIALGRRLHGLTAGLASGCNNIATVFYQNGFKEGVQVSSDSGGAPST
jgi:hypothetical protein